jgi:hypothetical protein
VTHSKCRNPTAAIREQISVNCTKAEQLMS